MTLQAEILAAFPLLPAGRDDGLIAATMSHNRYKIVPVPALSVRGAMYQMDVWSGVAAKANAAGVNTDVTPLALMCQSLYNMAMSSQDIPMNIPAINARVTADLNMMVAAGMMTAGQEAIIIGLATVPDIITPAMVSTALEGI